MRVMKTWLCLPLVAVAAWGAEFRLGIVGTDTSHVPAFTRAFNDPTAPDYIAGFRVVAAYKGGSPDLESSSRRVDKFAAEVQAKWGVEIVPDIATLCSKVDGVLLESVDGRVHLAQAREVIKARRPLFIDKPLAATLEDARELARLAREAGVAWFSSSSLRYSDVVLAGKAPDIQGAMVWGPGPLEEHHYLDLAWYAIHPIEMLYALMGPGCEEVTRVTTEGADLVAGRWKDGRIGSVRALRPNGGYGAVVFRPKQVYQSDPKARNGYGPLLKQIAEFFRTGVPPVPNQETLELFAFMDAAQRSKANGGRPMRLR